MSHIKGKNTRPEMLVRRGLHARGLRYRLHKVGMPGRPDIVFPKYRTVVFTHGCFWHGHECSLFKWPKTRADFWARKIESNRERDQKNLAALKSDGWRVFVVWECSLKGKRKQPFGEVLEKIEKFLRCSKLSFAEIKEK